MKKKNCDLAVSRIDEKKMNEKKKLQKRQNGLLPIFKLRVTIQYVVS